MFITKQLLNKKERKLMQPHRKQILKEVKASIADQDWQFSKKAQLMSRNQSKQNKKQTRPKTANPASSSLQRPKTPSSSLNYRPHTSSLTRLATTQQQIDVHGNSFINRVNYQFKELKQISSLFDSFFHIKKKKIQPQKFKYPQHVQAMKQNLVKKEKQQILNFEKMKRQRLSKTNENQVNQYIGYPRQKATKFISVANAKNQDVNMITRCIKGGYFSQADEFSDKINKSEILKLRKNFITMSSLYDDVKGTKNKGISEMSPQSIDRSSLRNLVYFLQNEKNFKYADKLAMQQKIKLIS